MTSLSDDFLANCFYLEFLLTSLYRDYEATGIKDACELLDVLSEMFPPCQRPRRVGKKARYSVAALRESGGGYYFQ